VRVHLHHVSELGEEVVGVVRSRRGFGVILDTEEGQLFVAHAFVSVVIEIEVGDFDVAGGERFGIDAEAVILRGDFDFLVEQVLNGMIGAVVAEFQFKGLAAERQSTELMAEADAENGDAAKELLNIFDGVADGLGIAGAVRKEDAIGI
jgi:hypothetical protein